MSKLLLALLVTFGLMASAQAEESLDQEPSINQVQHNHSLGKRPYSKIPTAKQSQDEKWVGAGIVTDSPDKGYDKHQQMRLNFIGKRPYIAPTNND